MSESMTLILNEQMNTLLQELTDLCKNNQDLTFSKREFDLLSALECRDDDIKYSAIFKMDELGKKLDEIVTRDHRFPGEETRMVRTGNGATCFYPFNIGTSLLRLALEYKSAEAAIEWALKVLGTKAATGKFICAIWGVPVDRQIQLTAEVKIVPIEDIPYSEQKKFIMGNFNTSTVTSMLDFIPPQSALILEKLIDPYIYDPKQSDASENDDFLKNHELFNEIITVLTVVGPRISMSSAYWFTFDDPDLERASLGGGRGGHMHEILPSSLGDFSILNEHDAQKIVQAYLSLSEPMRAPVRVALQRLNQAQRRRSVGDCAVEVATAFEALLGDKANNEMMHKITVRSVRLIGGTVDVRKRNAALLKKSYEVRSKLVHTGQANPSEMISVCGQRITTAALMKEVIVLCVQVIRVIILRRSIPDWSIFDITEHNEIGD
ncbi:hypothetical protein ACWYXK_11710 [Janthinobacterium lividum]